MLKKADKNTTKDVVTESMKQKAWARTLRQRVGKFRLSRYVMEKYPHDVMILMGQCIIIRAEHLLHTDEMEYIAWSPKFDQVAPGTQMPEYVWERNKGTCVAVKRE